MTNLVLHILASYTLWFVVTQSPVLLGWAKLRDYLMPKSEGFTRFMLCPICSGFWCSLFLAFSPALFNPSWGNGDAFQALVLALAGAAGVFLIETLVTRLQTR